MAWLLVLGGVVFAAASVRVGFACFVLAGLLLLALGLSLVLNLAGLSDRMVEEVTRGHSIQATSVSRFGGTVMAMGGVVAVAVGIAGLTS